MRLNISEAAIIIGVKTFSKHAGLKILQLNLQFFTLDYQFLGV